MRKLLHAIHGMLKKNELSTTLVFMLFQNLPDSKKLANLLEIKQSIYGVCASFRLKLKLGSSVTTFDAQLSGYFLKTIAYKIDTAVYLL